MFSSTRHFQNAFLLVQGAHGNLGQPENFGLSISGIFAIVGKWNEPKGNFGKIVGLDSIFGIGKVGTTGNLGTIGTTGSFSRGNFGTVRPGNVCCGVTLNLRAACTV